MAFSFLSKSGGRIDRGSGRFSFLGGGGATSDLASQVSNLETRLKASGVKVPPPKKEEGFLTKTLDILDRPRNAVATAIKYAADANPRTGMLQGLGEGITGKTKTRGSDLINSDNKVVNLVGGALLDIGLDPTTWLGGYLLRGMGIAAKTAGLPQAVKAVRGTATAQKYIEPVAQGLGKAFIPGFGLPSDYNTLKSSYRSMLTYSRDKALENVANIAKRYKLTDNEAEAVLRGIENPITLQGKDRRLVNAAREFKGLFRGGLRKEQAAGLKVGELPNYAPHVRVDTGEVIAPGRSTTPLRPSDKFSRSRKVAGTVEDINKSMGRQFFDPNIVTAAGVREYSRAGAVTTKKFVDDVLRQFGTKVKPGMKTPADQGVYTLKNFQLYPVEDVLGKQHMAFSKKVPTWALPKEIADDLNTFYKTFSDDQGTKAVLDLWDKVQNMWKGSVTSLRPSFHLRNFAGNVWNNFLAGVKNPQRYAKAAEIMSGQQGTLKAGNKVLTNDEVLDLFQRQGLQGIGQFYGDIRAGVKEAVNQSRLTGAQKLIYNLKHPVMGGRLIGNAIEDNAKLAHFVDRLIQGDTPAQAAKSVKKYLFDYQDLTTFERNAMRRVVPFYTFLRKNTPLQIEQLLKQPGKYTGVSHVVDNAYAVTGQEEGKTPDWLREQMALPIGNNKFFTPSLPLSDLNRTPETLMGAASPLLKLPAELTLNRSFLNKAPIERYEGQEVNVLGVSLPAKVAYALTNIGTLRDFQSLWAKGLVDKQYPVISSFIRQVDPDKQQVQEFYRRLDELRGLQQKAEKEQGKKVKTMKELVKPKPGGGKS